MTNPTMRLTEWLPLTVLSVLWGGAFFFVGVRSRSSWADTLPTTQSARRGCRQHNARLARLPSRGLFLGHPDAVQECLNAPVDSLWLFSHGKVAGPSEGEIL